VILSQKKAIASRNTIFVLYIGQVQRIDGFDGFFDN